LPAPRPGEAIYEELPDERFGLRKVEEFANSRLIRSDRINLDFATSLHRMPASAPYAAEGDVDVPGAGRRFPASGVPVLKML
jgi:hypothetical protein